MIGFFVFEEGFAAYLPISEAVFRTTHGQC